MKKQLEEKKCIATLNKGILVLYQM